MRVDQLLGGCWQMVEELASSPSAWNGEWLGPLQVEVVHLIRGGEEIDGAPLRVSLQLSYVAMPPLRLARPWEGGVIAECEPHHPFFIKDKGDHIVIDIVCVNNNFI